MSDFQPPRSLQTLEELVEAADTLLATLETAFDEIDRNVDAGRLEPRTEHELREAFSKTSALLADFRHGTNV